MVIVSYPGVYVEEVASGVRPISAASTSTPAFVGLAQSGSTTEALRITNWTQFERIYGGFLGKSFLAHSVFQFFNNGGQQCYVLRVAPSDARMASLTLQNSAEPATAGIQLSAKNVGAWANNLLVTVKPDGDLFQLVVERALPPEVVEPAPPLEVHNQLSMDPGAPSYVVDVLRQRSALLNARDLHGDDAVPLAQRRPPAITAARFGESPSPAGVAETRSGADGDLSKVNEVLYENGFALLDNKTDFSLLAVPGVATSAMANAGMAYCRRRPLQDVFYLGDMPPDTTAEGALAFLIA